MDAAIAINDLVIRYGDFVAVNNLTLSVNAGQVSACSGPTAPARQPRSCRSPGRSR